MHTNRDQFQGSQGDARARTTQAVRADDPLQDVSFHHAGSGGLVGSPRPSTRRKVAVPRVSAVIAFRNGEPFLQAAIESVFAQTFTDWELLLVDDGSSDCSMQTALAAVARAPHRVRTLAHPGNENRGLPASRNLGMRHARGELIAFLDADDVWLHDKLARQVDAFDGHPDVAMVYGPSEWWHGWTGRDEDARRDFEPHLQVAPDVVHPPPLLLPLLLRHPGISPCPSSIMVRREAAERVGLCEERFRGPMGLYEDQAFYAKIALDYPILRLDGCVARYRQHGQQMTSTPAAGHDAARRFYLEWLSERVRERGQETGEVQRIITAEYRTLTPTRVDRVRRALVGIVRGVARRVVPLSWRPWLRNPRALGLYAWRLPILRQLAMVRFRRLQPMYGGREVGTPIVRWYWMDFLDRHRADVRGDALELGTTATVGEYGGDRLRSADAMDFSRRSTEITVVADLSRADAVQGERYDCFILQFTTHEIADVEAALYHALRLLRPGGVLLVNFLCVDAEFRSELDAERGLPRRVHWCFTPLQVHNLLRRVGLDSEDYALEIHGNLFARIASHLNMPAEAVMRRELMHQDPTHPVLVCARVVRPSDWDMAPPQYREAWVPQAQSQREGADAAA